MKLLSTSLRMILVMTILTGFLYPFIVTGIARVLCPEQADGSTVFHKGSVVGSRLVGQNFHSDIYFWPRPSATAYNPLPSSGTNLGPISQILHDSVLARANRLGGTSHSLPADLLLASASGLDPDLTPEAAQLQIPRVAIARGLTGHPELLDSLVRSHIEPLQWGLFGELRVNVLELNLALDSLHP
jgi:potassium-transporting ATPase KdpC subunit